MENLIKNSLILSGIYRLITLISKKYKESFIHNFFLSLSKNVNNLLEYSRIYKYLRKYDSIDGYWKQSKFYNIVNSILFFPTKIFRKFYYKYEDILNKSIFLKLLGLLSKNFVYILGISLVVNMVIPDHRWFNIYGVLIAMGIGFIYFIKTIIEENHSFSLEGFDFSYILFFIAITISMILSLFPRDSVNDYIYYIITFFTMIIIVNSIKNKKDLNIIIKALIFGLILTAIYGVYQWKIIGIEVNPSLTDITVNQGMSGRVFSTMGNPNIYGELLVLILPLFLVMFFNSKDIRSKLIYLILLAPVLVILLKTGSRSAWVSFAVSIFIFTVLKDIRFLPVMILLGIMAVPILPQSIYRRILTIFNPNDSSLKYRKQILEPAIPMLKDYWITGVGLGSEVFNTIYKRYKSAKLKTVAHTHNLYLQLWLESGILALAAFFLVVFRLFKSTFYIMKEKDNPYISNILIGCLSSIGGLLVMGFADHVWFYKRILFIFWIIVSIMYAAINIYNKEKAQG